MKDTDKKFKHSIIVKYVLFTTIALELKLSPDNFYEDLLNEQNF